MATDKAAAKTTASATDARNTGQPESWMNQSRQSLVTYPRGLQGGPLAHLLHLLDANDPSVTPSTGSILTLLGSRPSPAACDPGRYRRYSAHAARMTLKRHDKLTGGGGGADAPS